MAIRQEIHHRIPGRQLPLRDRLNQHDFARRRAMAEFTQKKENPRSFETVMKYVGKIVENFTEDFSDKDTPIFRKWHVIRVEMLDLPLNTPNYAKISRDKRVEEFDKLFFIDPETGKFDENKYIRVQPVLKEITHLVSKGI